MKLTLFLLVVLMISCQEKDASPGFQGELFSYLKSAPSTNLKCDPSFATLREDELTVFCLPITEVELKDAVKSETTALTIKWTTEKDIKLKSVATRFTDEIVTEDKK